MKRVIISLLVMSLLVPGSTARALDNSALFLNDDQIKSIRQHCIRAQATMTRIHAHDALTRINLVQQFETISSRLMAPLNSRIAANKLDGLDLARTTVDYNKEIDHFRTVYRDYEQTLSTTMQMDCTNQPVGFYDNLTLAREQRGVVHASVKKLQEYVKQYRAQFDEFRARVEQPAETETKP